MQHSKVSDGGGNANQRYEIEKAIQRFERESPTKACILLNPEFIVWPPTNHSMLAKTPLLSESLFAIRKSWQCAMTSLRRPHVSFSNSFLKRLFRICTCLCRALCARFSQGLSLCTYNLYADARLRLVGQVLDFAKIHPVQSG